MSVSFRSFLIGDVVRGRGVLVAENGAGLYVFQRKRSIYSAAGTTYDNVFDVVEYNEESPNGRQVVTFGNRRDARAYINN